MRYTSSKTPLPPAISCMTYSKAAIYFFDCLARRNAMSTMSDTTFIVVVSKNKDRLNEASIFQHEYTDDINRVNLHHEYGTKKDSYSMIACDDEVSLMYPWGETIYYYRVAADNADDLLIAMITILFVRLGCKQSAPIFVDEDDKNLNYSLREHKVDGGTYEIDGVLPINDQAFGAVYLGPLYRAHNMK